MRATMVESRSTTVESRSTMVESYATTIESCAATNWIVRAYDQGKNMKEIAEMLHLRNARNELYCQHQLSVVQQEDDEHQRQP